MPKEVVINVNEVTVVSGKKKSINVNINGLDVHIPVDQGVYAYFNEQFSREHPTALKQKKFATVIIC